MVGTVSVVALSGLFLVATHGNTDDATPAASQPRATPTPTSTPTSTTSPHAPAVTITPVATAPPPPVVKPSQVFVVVFNNSNVKGLAGRTATRAQHFGWNVVGSDNWYGTIDTSTVYFGPALHAAATLLAKDLGIASVKPAVSPMRADRLTVILTSTYH
jgi:hypothetical protein